MQLSCYFIIVSINVWEVGGVTDFGNFTRAEAFQTLKLHLESEGPLELGYCWAYSRF